MQKGMHTATYTRMSPSLLSTRLRSVMSRYSGPSAMKVGIIWVTSAAISRADLVRNSKRAST